MTILSIPQMSTVWMRNGGARSAVVVAVSVAKAESNGWAEAVSPSADYGIWQINISNLRARGISISEAFDPDVSAQIAIDMSGNGSNWAPWCTCWVNPARDCGHGHLSVPQPGSPADYHIAGVAATLGEFPPTAVDPTPTTSNADAFGRAWGTVAGFHTTYARGAWESLHNLRTAVDRSKG